MTDFPRPCLMLVTEPSPNLTEIVRAAVAGGVNIVQWRDKVSKQPELLQLNDAMREASAPALLITNGPRAELADGRHLPSRSAITIRFLRDYLPGKLVGRSVHSQADAQKAVKEGADYVVAGTIFASASHPDSEPAGLEFLRTICSAVSLPVLAIGGVTPENLGICIKAGASGIAMMSPIMHGTEPKRVAQAYRAALDIAWEEQ